MTPPRRDRDAVVDREAEIDALRKPLLEFIKWNACTPEDVVRATRMLEQLERAVREAAAAGQGASVAAHDVLAERERQKAVEGYDVAHDDEHIDGSLAGAAAAYALASCREANENLLKLAWEVWPWDSSCFKVGASRRRELVKAGALILAEIERIDRSALAAKAGERAS